MAFLDKAGLQTLTNKLVQGDAIKVASSRGYTVKNVIDNITRECSDVENPQTMALENETSHFMIGEGKDVNVSGDIEAGKMAFGFKGRTLQNFIKTDVPLQNSLSSPTIVYKAGKLHPMKNGGVYTIIIFEVPKEVQAFYFKKPNAVRVESKNFIRRGNNILHSFTTNGNIQENSDLSLHLYPNKSEDRESLQRYNKIKVLILEGDWTNKEIPPLFTGIKSSFETEEERKVLHTGKNLWKMSESGFTRFDRKDIRFDEAFLSSGKTYVISNKSIHRETSELNELYPAIRFTHIEPDGTETGKAVHFIKDGEEFTFTPKADINRIVLYSYKVDWVNSVGKFFSIENFQIEEGKGATEYAPYIKEEKTIELDEPLRSLPGGVCDEITEDGKLIRRVKRVLINQLQIIAADNGLSNTVRGAINVPDVKDGCRLMSSSIFTPITSGTSSDDYENIQATGGRLYLRVLKTRLSQTNNIGISDWLKKQPDIFIYYELKETQTSDVSCVDFDISQHNRIDISSNISPITTYKVPLNRAAQIDNSIKTIQELKQRIELLEQAYDNHFLESQYKLSLLKLEHQIESEEI